MLRLIVGVAFFWLWITPLAAQDAPPPITLTSVESLVPLTTMGRGTPRFVQFSPDGATLAVGSSVGVWLYDTADLSAPPQQFWMDIPTTVLAFSPAGGLIAVGAADGTGRVFERATNRQLTYLVGGPVPERGAMANYNVPATAVSFSAVAGTGHKTSGMGAVSSTPVTDSDGTVWYLDVSLGGGVPDQTQASTSTGLTASITDYQVTVGETILAGFTQPFLYATMDAEFIGRWMSEAAELPADRPLLLTVGIAGQWLVWDIETGAVVSEQRVQAIPSDVVTARGGDWEARADGDDGAISVIDTANNQQFTLSEPSELNYVRKVTALAFHPDGHILAAGRHDTNLALWDMTARQPITTQYAHFGAVMALDWSPDGTILYSGGEDNRVFAWELTDAAEYPLQNRAFLGGHAAPVIGVWALDDGARLLTVSRDGTALVWGIPNQ